MSNPLYESIKKQTTPEPQQDFFTRFNQFAKTVTGNPKQQIEQLLNSGKISQSQYNAAVQKANMIARMFGGK